MGFSYKEIGENGAVISDALVWRETELLMNVHLPNYHYSPDKTGFI